jgi:D-3-phosphoglycerate dehydrogenase
VNFPNIQAPHLREGRRLLNVHKNVPGVLGEINSIVSRKGINIHSQLLSTDEEIGFLLMDFEAGADEAFKEIGALDTNIKTRLL